MAIKQPTSGDFLNDPDHSLSHRVFANDGSAPVQSVVVDENGETYTSGNIQTSSYKDALHYGATLVHATLQAAITDIGSDHWTLNISRGTWVIDANLTFHANTKLVFEEGAVFDIADTYTVTINGTVDAGFYQIFDLNATGAVSFGSNKQKIINDEWWGAASSTTIHDDVLIKDKISFTQDDKNEYIDSLNDGYMDYGATTAHRFNTPIRATTSLWYSPPQHVRISSANPGSSGATWVPSTATVQSGWQLDADAEILTFEGDVHSDWDAASDLEVKVTFESNVDNTTGEDADTVDLKLISYYKGTGDLTNKTQTTTHECTVGKIDDHEQCTCTILLNYDEVDNVIEAGDKFSFILNLVTATSEVADITINHIHIRYKTAKVGIEV